MKTAVISFLLMISVGMLNAQKTIEELEKENQELKDSIAKTTQLVDAISTLNKRLNRDFDGDKKERVQLGLSFAYGELSSDDRSRYRLPTINPVDSTLAFQQLDGRFILVSTTMTVTPFLYADWISSARSNIDASTKYRKLKKTCLWLLENSGFSVNINFLEIATGSSQQSFNQIVEGGIGYSVPTRIYIGASREN